MAPDGNNCVAKELFFTVIGIFKAIFIAMIRVFISPREKSVQGNFVLLTGGGSGIGRLMAVELARRGAIIVSWDINKEGNEETARLVKEAGSECHTYTVDISKRDHIDACAKKVEQEVGNIDILINNAGIVSGRKFLDLTDEMIIKTFEVNVFSHFWIVRRFLPSMMSRPHGHIVCISSMLGLNAFSSVSDYAGSKAAVIRYTEALREELLFGDSEHVHVTVVCPHHINTNLFAGCKVRSVTPSLLGGYMTVKTFLPTMVNRGHGHIVNIASVAGLLGANRLADYCASKYADVGFTESLDNELVAEGHNVNVTTVCPYFINTGMFDGCINRFPGLLPTLDPDNTAKRIVKAIVTNQKVLYIPRMMYLMIVLKSVLPVDAFLLLHKFLGATNFMDTFAGRKKKD